jgi:mRNA-degrading endonuclease toxin of MazEF toxin-antitoxin module
LRSLSTTRCLERIGTVDGATMETVERRLGMVFGIDVAPEGE